MPLSIVTALVRNLVTLPGAVLRSRVAKNAEALALRHENAVLRCQIAPVRYEPADRMMFAPVPTGPVTEPSEPEPAAAPPSYCSS